FEANALTVLAFWTTHCAECVRRLEVCQELQDWGRDDGLGVVGVNFDDSHSARMETMVREATPRLLQLLDAGGRVAAAYGAGAHSFSICLIDEAGTIRRTYHDIPADSLARLRPQIEEMMSAVYAAPAREPSPAELEPAASSFAASHPSWLLEKLGGTLGRRLEIHGGGRIRWMDIDTTGTGATGPFGEAVDPGSSLRQRLELELIYAATSKLRVGGLIWLSNEGEAVLRSGPDYLSAPWGSAFIRYDTAARIAGLGRLFSSLRAGYYDLSFTPLTLMRWDDDDSPISGGQRVQGCGVCGGEAGLAGFIRSESLERLAPEYTFEGARWGLALGGRLDLTAMYARPLMHWPRQYDEILPQDDPNYADFRVQMRFKQEIYGGHLSLHLPFAWSPDPATLAGTLLFVDDDAEDWPWGLADGSTGIYPPYAPGTDRLAGASLRLPLPYRIECDGEVVQSRWDAGVSPGSPDDPAPVEASAFRAQAGMDLRERGGPAPFDLLPAGMTAKLRAGYQHIGTDFFSPYSALSYEANAHPSQDGSLVGFSGPRFSLRIDRAPFGVGFFAKHLAPIDEEADNPLTMPAGERRMASLWADAAPWASTTLTLGWIKDDRDPLPLQSSAPAEERRIWIASAEFELGPRAVLMIEAQWLKGTRLGDEVEPAEKEYSSRTVRMMLDVEF
ncbi:MAG: TlpA disulfide reductase family protein, partial [Candidatus Eisenbacteria bacterium]